MRNPDDPAPDPAPTPERFTELDGLRGLAALAVVTSHLIVLLQAPAWWGYTPFYGALEAVLLFFMLSGFVLALPFLRGPVPKRTFWLRRFFRIWPTYVAALALAAGLIWAYPTGDMRRLHDGGLWLQHLTMVTSFNTAAFDGVIWSLVHEMRMSLLFPFLMAAVLAWPARRVLALAVVSSLVGTFGDRALTRWHLSSDYMHTLHYGALFLVGFLLARHRVALVAWWTGVRPGVRQGILAGAFVLYTVTAQPGVTLPVGALWAMLNDWAIALAAAVLLVAAQAPGRWQNCLRHPICAFLGTISYSLYLVHMPLLRVVVFRIFPGKLPAAAIALVGLVVSIAVAYAFTRLIERPTMALGRKLAGWRPAWGGTAPKVTGV